MRRIIGTRSLGLRTPFIKADDDLEEILIDVLKDTIEYEGVVLKDKDILCITESLLARAQGNFCKIKDIVEELDEKFDERIGVVYPILSRNRFSLILQACVMTGKKVDVFLSYPNDEVGNPVIDHQLLFQRDINYSKDTITEDIYELITKGGFKHPFTNLDYVKLYKSYAKDPDQMDIYLTNNPHAIRKRTDEILICNVHDRDFYRDLFGKMDFKHVYTMADLLNQPTKKHGFNPEYGLYGSNLSSEDEVKLFPRDSQPFVEKLQKRIFEEFDVNMEVMIYGDGAFKDPVAQIWELADPIIAPGATEGLAGTPNEIKLKYIADTKLRDEDPEEVSRELRKEIKNREDSNKDFSLGTTPRRITDLLGSLADLTSGSGDKGTPVVLVQGYFDNYADD